MEETWKEIPGTDGHYQASNLGRIKSNVKTVWRRYKNSDQLINEKDSILECNKLTVKGYKRVNLRFSDVPGVHFIHRLVAMTFLGMPQGERNQVNHKNGIKTDNRLENLEWVTNQENRDHAVSNNLVANRASGYCKFTYDDVKKIKKLKNSGLLQKEIANIFNTKQQTISSLLRVKDP
jgi:hypothetical protein